MIKPSSRSPITTLAFLSLLAAFFFFYLSILPLMAEATTKPQEPEVASVHIVYVERPQDEEPEAFNILTLASVVGSEEAAKEALIYHYKTAASGFSAKLTPSQVEELSKKPGVLQVTPSRTVSLHGPRTTATIGLMGV